LRERDPLARNLKQTLLHRFHAKYAFQLRGTAAPHTHWFSASLGGHTMRWKISHRGHDPRQIDLIAIFALLVIIIAAFRFYTEDTPPPSTTAFIVPSQSVHW
jgi:hypothetical protein